MRSNMVEIHLLKKLRDALIIGIGRLVRWYRRLSFTQVKTLVLGAFLFYLHSAVLQVIMSSRITVGA